MVRESFYEDPYEYGDADEMKPGDAGTEEEYDRDVIMPWDDDGITTDPWDEYDSEDGEDWPSEPEDWRHGEPAGDEGWS